MEEAPTAPKEGPSAAPAAQEAAKEATETAATPVAEAPAPSTNNPAAAEHVTVLEALIDKLQEQDKNKYFWFPVTLAMAPDYGKKIKTPMSLQVRSPRKPTGLHRTSCFASSPVAVNKYLPCLGFGVNYGQQRLEVGHLFLFITNWLQLWHFGRVVGLWVNQEMVCCRGARLGVFGRLFVSEQKFF